MVCNLVAPCSGLEFLLKSRVQRRPANQIAADRQKACTARFVLFLLFQTLVHSLRKLIPVAERSRMNCPGSFRHAPETNQVYPKRFRRQSELNAWCVALPDKCPWLPMVVRLPGKRFIRHDARISR